MSEPRRLRVLVVDDSPTQRQHLARILTQDPSIDLAGSATNGAEAVRAVARLRPDVVTLDDRMPIMGGLEAARQIMRETPTPIVMVTAASGAEARQLADEALAIGVLSVQGKRALSTAEPAAVAELVRLIKGMAEVRVVRSRRDVSASEPRLPARTVATPELVAIGASTGGPAALRDLLSRLPATFGVPIVVVQHTTVGYAHTLVSWLSSATRLPVRLAEHAQPLGTGVYVAPTGRHLLVEGRRLALVEGPPVSLHCPSATLLFRSVAQSLGARGAGVLLTGMGDDGAEGLLEMKRAGALTIAQDEASSVVFGMPGEAIRLGAAHHVLPPHRIAALLSDVVTRKETTAWT